MRKRNIREMSLSELRGALRDAHQVGAPATAAAIEREFARRPGLQIINVQVRDAA